MTRSALALIALILSHSTAFAEEKYFVKYWITSFYPVHSEDDADPGRIEVSKTNGEFVACSQAFVVKDWDGFVIAPISTGFIYYGDPKLLKFELHGELKENFQLKTDISKVP